MKYTNGSVFPQTRNGKQVWMVEVVTGYNPDGSRRRTRRQVATKSEALKLRAELLGKAYNGELAPRSKEILDSFALWWLRTAKAPQVRPATAGDYEARYRLHISPIFGSRKIGDITARDVTNWLAHLSSKGHSISSINGVRRVLSMIMDGAIQHDHISKNPVKAVPKHKQSFNQKTHVKGPWSKQEAQTAITLVKDTPVELAVTLALVLGLRKGEVLGLRWSDFDFQHGTVRIARSRREARIFDKDGNSTTKVELYPPKNATSARLLILGPTVSASLLNHRAKQAEIGHYIDGGWVFTNTKGLPLAPSGLYKRYRQWIETTGLTYIRFHDLRHSAANLALAGKARIEAVSQFLGHSNIHTTKSIYAPYVEALNAEYVSAVEDQINSPELAGLASQAPPQARGGG
jgi:integrase